MTLGVSVCDFRLRTCESGANLTQASEDFNGLRPTQASHKLSNGRYLGWLCLIPVWLKGHPVPGTIPKARVFAALFCLDLLRRLPTCVERLRGSSCPGQSSEHIAPSGQASGVSMVLLTFS